MVKLTNRYEIMNPLEAFATLANEQNRPARTLCLAAAAMCQRTVAAFVLPPIPQKHFDQTVASARCQLSTEEADAAWDAGAAMTLDEAVVYALAM